MESDNVLPTESEKLLFHAAMKTRNVELIAAVASLLGSYVDD